MHTYYFLNWKVQKKIKTDNHLELITPPSNNQLKHTYFSLGMFLFMHM